MPYLNPHRNVIRFLLRGVTVRNYEREFTDRRKRSLLTASHQDPQPLGSAEYALRCEPFKQPFAASNNLSLAILASVENFKDFSGSSVRFRQIIPCCRTCMRGILTQRLPPVRTNADRI